jgi:hypothetical protein
MATGATAPLLETIMKKLEYFAKYQEYRRAAASKKDRTYYNELACTYLAKYMEKS